MGSHSHNPYRADAAASNSIDRKREQERRYLLQAAFKNSEELAVKLVQRLLDKHIIETNSVDAIREALSHQLKNISELEEHDFNFKIAPIRQLVANPNILSLYMTQYIIEDLINHRDIEDIFGDEGDVYAAVDSVLSSLRSQ
jgi:hypothetical protein